MPFICHQLRHDPGRRWKVYARRYKNSADQHVYRIKLARLISQPSPRRRGKPSATPQQARMSQLPANKWHLSAKGTSLNDGKLKQRHLRPYFTRTIFIATSRCRKPTSARLFETPRHLALWDSALPKRGLPPLLETNFEKAHGAPVTWERLNRSRPQNDLKAD